MYVLELMKCSIRFRGTWSLNLQELKINATDVCSDYTPQDLAWLPVTQKAPRWEYCPGYEVENLQVQSCCSWTNNYDDAAGHKSFAYQIRACVWYQPTASQWGRQGRCQSRFIDRKRNTLVSTMKRKGQENRFLHLPTSQDIYVGEF